MDRSVEYLAASCPRIYGIVSISGNGDYHAGKCVKAFYSRLFCRVPARFKCLVLKMADYGFQYNVEEYLADSDSDLGDISDFEGFVEGVDFEAGHKVHADSLLDDSNWVEGDRTDAPVTFVFGRRPGLRVEVPDNPDILAIFELFFTV